MIRKRCAIYIRVSTEMQVEDGYSFEEQEVRLLERAKEKGFEVVGVYRE
jgi:DNA invertase Pin-like site-specific DNA recombinase